MKSYQILLTFLTLTHLLVAKPSKSDGGFISLFDGKTLDGWTQRNGTATYKVVDNTIVGTTAKEAPTRSSAQTNYTVILNSTLK